MCDNYRAEAIDDAKCAINDNSKAVAQYIIDHEDTPTSISEIEELQTYVDENEKDFSLKEAAQCLEDLRDHQADDSGLWEGLEPIEAVKAMAAYTYRNAVYHFVNEKLSGLSNVVDDYLEHQEQSEESEDDELEGFDLEEEIENAV